jgi:hypothetical protein
VADENFNGTHLFAPLNNSGRLLSQEKEKGLLLRVKVLKSSGHIPAAYCRIHIYNMGRCPVGIWTLFYKFCWCWWC